MSIVHNIHICLWGIGRMYTHLKYIILSDLSASQGSMEVVGRGEFSPPGSSVCCHSSLRCWFKSSLLVESTSLTLTTWLNHVSPNFLFIVPAGLGKRKTPAGRDRTMRVSAFSTGFVQVTNRCWSSVLSRSRSALWDALGLCKSVNPVCPPGLAEGEMSKDLLVELHVIPV